MPGVKQQQPVLPVEPLYELGPWCWGGIIINRMPKLRLGCGDVRTDSSSGATGRRWFRRMLGWRLWRMSSAKLTRGGAASNTSTSNNDTGGHNAVDYLRSTL